MFERALAVAVVLSACAPRAPTAVYIAPVDGGAASEASPDPGGYRSEAQATLEQGNAALDQGDLDRADDAYRKVLRVYAYSKLARVAEVRLADILAKRGRYDEAAQAYEAFLHNHPSSELFDEVKAKYEDVRARPR